MPTVAAAPTELTPRQAEVLAWLFETTMKNGFQPSLREMCAHFGYASTNSMNVHLAPLARKGWIWPGNRQNRAVRFLRTPSGAPFRGFREAD